MKIGYSEVEAVIRAIHGSGAKPTALLGRLKYLQRFNWPPGGAKGQGSRDGYGLEQLLGMMLAVELLEVGMTPLRVVRLLRTSWDLALKLLIIGWVQNPGGKQPGFLALAPRILEELGMAEDEARPSPDRLVHLRPGGFEEWAENVGSGSTSVYIVDPRRLAAAARREVVALEIMDADQVDTWFLDAGGRLFGVPEPLIWRMPQHEVD